MTNQENPIIDCLRFKPFLNDWRSEVKYLRHFKSLILLFVLNAVSSQPAAFSQVAPSSAGTAPQSLRDGQHDFDFHFGMWETHIKRLTHPLSGSTSWIELNGTVTVRKIWDGRANLEELDAGNGTGHLQGLTLFLYNPKSLQWTQTFANANDGTLDDRPLIGEFKNGRGEFYAHKRNQMALLRIHP